MSSEATRLWLNEQWTDILDEAESSADPELDRFVDSTILTIRYAIVTQLLGKVADHSRSLLSLQASDIRPGAWDPRSFCKRIIVPWVGENHAVLGTSTDPYVSKPLRRPSITDSSPTRQREGEWQALASYLHNLEQEDQAGIEREFQRCLRSIARRLRRQQFDYPVPLRISHDRLDELIDSLMRVPSGGLHPMVVSAASLRVLGRAFSLYSKVVSQGVNEADVATGMPGDIACYDDARIVLVVEVKDRTLTLVDLRDSVTKALNSGEIENLLFAVPRLDESDRDSIKAKIEGQWASGLNIYHLDIRSLVSAAFVLLEEHWRTELLREIGRELDNRGVYASRERWRLLLAEPETEGDVT